MLLELALFFEVSPKEFNFCRFLKKYLVVFSQTALKIKANPFGREIKRTFFFLILWFFLVLRRGGAGYFTSMI